MLDVSTTPPRLLEQITVPGVTSGIVAMTSGVYVVDGSGTIEIFE